MYSSKLIVSNVYSLENRKRVRWERCARLLTLGCILVGCAGSGPGQIDFGATLEALGIDDRPDPLTALQKQATILHLLKSVSGINQAAAGEIPSMTAEKRR
jgi:hypothetical protein